MRRLLVIAPLLLAGCDTQDIEIRETPITVQDEVVGYGREAEPGTIVTIEYVMTLPDGQEVLKDDAYRFELSREDRGAAVIAGINEAVKGMRVGGRRAFRCPPHKHWGRAGFANGVIPPNTDLLVEMKLVKVESSHLIVR